MKNFKWIISKRDHQKENSPTYCNPFLYRFWKKGMDHLHIGHPEHQFQYSVEALNT